MRNSLLLVCSTVLVLFVAGCSSSSGAKLIDSYRAPGTVSFVFDKGAVMALNGGPELRAAFEDTIIAQSGRTRLVAVHTVLTADDLRSKDVVRQKLLEKGFDGILTMRAIRPTEVNPYESTPGETFSSYAQSVPPGEPPFGEGRMLIETNIFRLDDEALVWRGVVDCEKSSDPQQIVREAVKVMLSNLRQTGLVHD